MSQQQKKFLRFLRQPTKKIKSINQNISHLPYGEILSDMFNGFETTSNTLSLYSFSNQKEKERLIVNFDICKNKCLSISEKISYFEFNLNFLTQLKLNQQPSQINEYFDQLALTNHCDIINLNSSSLIKLIIELNNELINPKNTIFNVVERSDLRKMIQQSFNNNYIIWKRDPYLLEDYKNKAFNQ